MNCFSLNSVGSTWEQIAGAPRFLTVYAVACLATTLASYKFSSHAVGVGASGAIFGLAGAVTINTYRLKHFVRLEEDAHSESYRMVCKFFNRLLLVLAFNALIGLTILPCDNWGHAAGFLAGAAVAWFLGPLVTWDEIVTSVANQPSLGPNVENSEERSSLDELSNERVQALS